MKKPIYLIGYRATGKSIIGKEIAEILEVPFIDLDELIKREAGKEIAEIVAEDGWNAFRELEQQALSILAAREEPVVVSCGGGAVVHKEVWPLIKKKALVVWLKARPETILARIAQDSTSQMQRPRLTNNGSTMEEEIEQTMLERYPLYKHYSDMAIETDFMNPTQVAQKIVEEVAG